MENGKQRLEVEFSQVDRMLVKLLTSHLRAHELAPHLCLPPSFLLIQIPFVMAFPDIPVGLNFWLWD